MHPKKTRREYTQEEINAELEYMIAEGFVVRWFDEAGQAYCRWKTKKEIQEEIEVLLQTA